MIQVTDPQERLHTAGGSVNPVHTAGQIWATLVSRGNGRTISNEVMTAFLADVFRSTSLDVVLISFDDYDFSWKRTHGDMLKEV